MGSLLLGGSRFTPDSGGIYRNKAKNKEQKVIKNAEIERIQL